MATVARVSASNAPQVLQHPALGALQQLLQAHVQGLTQGPQKSPLLLCPFVLSSCWLFPAQLVLLSTNFDTFDNNPFHLRHRDVVGVYIPTFLQHHLLKSMKSPRHGRFPVQKTPGMEPPFLELVHGSIAFRGRDVEEQCARKERSGTQTAEARSKGIVLIT